MHLSFPEYAQLDATALASLIAQGQITAAGAVETAYALIRRLDPQLNAFVPLENEPGWPGVMQGVERGPFFGVPMALKNCVGFVNGVERTFGSRLARGLLIDHDSEVIARYRAAGFVFVGTTNTPEMSASVTTEPVMYGPTHNPWKHGYSVGGSSGGSACAVAAGIVPVAYANDGAGSIRVPAASCGVFGLKPSRGRVPSGPIDTEFWHGWMMHHVITRSVRDSAAILDVADGLDTGAPYAAPAKERPYVAELGRAVKGLRVAYSEQAPNGATVAPDCRRALQRTLELLADLGCSIEEAAPEYDGVAFLDGLTTMMSVTLARELPALATFMKRTADPTTVEKCNLILAERGAAVPATELQNVLRANGWLTRELGRFFVGYDVLVTPTTARPAPPHGWLNADSDDADEYMRRLWSFSPFTPLANATGVPSMSVPLAWTDDGLPVGTMFTARYGDEATLFRLASQLEEACPWARRRPPIGAWSLGD